MQVFSTVSNCRKCVAFCLKDVEICEESIKESVPDQAKLEESSENVRKDKHSLSGNEKEEVKKKEEAREEKIGGVSLCSCFYLFHVAETHLNAIQTS